MIFPATPVAALPRTETVKTAQALDPTHATDASLVQPAPTETPAQPERIDAAARPAVEPVAAGAPNSAEAAVAATRDTEIDPSLIGRGLYTFESGLEAARPLLDRPDRPTAIFAQNDDMAAGAIIAAGELGIAVPGELSVAGFDDSQIASTVWPRITTIRQPIRAMAQAATDALVKLMEGSHRAPEHRLMPYELIVRGSTGPVRT